MANTNEFVIELRDFFQGLSPLAYLDSLTQKGNEGHASTMTNADILTGYITQGPALLDLATGTPSAVTELINHILDIPTADSVTYGIGATKLFQITPTAVTNAGIWPHAITNCTDGESVAYLKGILYYFYNTATQGGIGAYDLVTTFDDTWTVTLEKAIHPVAVKEDIMLFGNGKYVGKYTDSDTTLTVDKLDFGDNHEIADIVYFGNYWYIAVNGGVSGTNRSTGQIYLYDGAALDAVLADETGIGSQKIGFIYVVNGIVFVAYQDLSSTNGYHIGYVLGRQIKRLASFSGGLPNFAQKTLYQSTILYVAGSSLWSCGATSPDLPSQISQIADGGYDTIGALAAPFGTPMVASTDGATNFRLAKFSGYDTLSSWKSIVIPTSAGRRKGYIDEISVLSNSLGDSAGATLTIEADQATRTSNSKTIATTGKQRHIFNNIGLGGIIDMRVCISFSTGSASNPCKIRNIVVKGHYIEE